MRKMPVSARNASGQKAAQLHRRVPSRFIPSFAMAPSWTLLETSVIMRTRGSIEIRLVGSCDAWKVELFAANESLARDGRLNPAPSSYQRV
jgi:hypothetical protein